MKFSEFLKTDGEKQRVLTPEPPVPQSAPAPPPPKPKISQPLPPAPAPLPPPGPSEKQIREDIEKEFMSRLQKMEQELKNITAENLKDQELIFEEKQKSIEKEKQRLAGELRELKENNEKLESARAAMEIEFEKRLLEQKKQFQEQMQKNMEGFQQQQSEEIQRKLFQREQEILEKQRQLEEQLKKNAAAAVPPPPPPAPVSAPAPAPIPAVAIPPAVQVSSAADYVLTDPKTEEKIRKTYQALAQTGDQVFQYITRDSKVELDFLRKILSDLIGLVEAYDQDFLGIVLEPYPTADYFTYHSANCAILAIILGLEMKMDREDIKDLALASFIHDVGLLGIRENLDYPKQLNSEIKSEIMKHPQRTVEILAEKIPENVRAGILQHHETLNGKGYPAGLSGDDIHPFARVIHIVDAFEAMTHHRPYRPKAMEVSEAMKEMVDRGRGVYAREPLKALMNRIGLYPVLSLVELSNKQIARVLKQSRKFPLSPVVKIEFDEEGKKLRAPQIIDLSKNQLIHILGPMGTTPSYGKERQEKHVKPEKEKSFSILEVVPFLLVLGVLAGLVYLVLKL